MLEEMLSVADIAEQIQKECHNTVEYIAKNGKPEISYQDATNVFLFRKLAELQSEVNYLRGILK